MYLEAYSCYSSESNSYLNLITSSTFEFSVVSETENGGNDGVVSCTTADVTLASTWLGHLTSGDAASITEGQAAVIAVTEPTFDNNGDTSSCIATSQTIVSIKDSDGVDLS
jgi:hypothetical protein